MSSWGLEEQRPASYDKCPKCGAAAIDNDGHGFATYTCGTMYEDCHCTLFNEQCQSKSYTTKRRIATVTGILRACDTAERAAVVDGLVDWLDEQKKKVQLQHKINTKLKPEGLACETDAN